MQTMEEHSMRLAVMGVTSLTEVTRVVRLGTDNAL
jgi:hypothetical protein